MVIFILCLNWYYLRQIIYHIRMVGKKKEQGSGNSMQIKPCWHRAIHKCIVGALIIRYIFSKSICRVSVTDTLRKVTAYEANKVQNKWKWERDNALHGFHTSLDYIIDTKHSIRHDKSYDIGCKLQSVYIPRCIWSQMITSSWFTPAKNTFLYAARS